VVEMPLTIIITILVGYWQVDLSLVTVPGRGLSLDGRAGVGAAFKSEKAREVPGQFP